MSSEAGFEDMSADASLAAQDAARRAGVTVRELSDYDDLVQASSLIAQVWQIKDMVTGGRLNLGIAMVHAGIYLTAAYSDERMVGALMGFLGLREEIHLHSHMLGVLPNEERRGIGFALKQHQRAWALQQGFNTVRWTFDPLVRRNAYFNLCKLGAELSDYHINFYRDMTGGLNAGDESDRAVVRWRLDSERAAASSRGESVEPDIEELLSSGAQIALDEGPNGTPINSDAGGEVLLCHIPEDIIAIRATNPEAALDWRRALRDTLGQALSSGYFATGIAKSGWYVLERGSSLP